jgi:hypothetical protein
MQQLVDLKAPHGPKQQAMVEHPGSVVAMCGRRFGKTDAYVQRILWQATTKPGLYWWVGLSWRSASLKRAWREMTAIARQVYRAMGLDERHLINNSRYEIIIPGLCEIWFRTADNPSSLAGEGICGAVLDEFTLMDERVWTEYVEGTLVDLGGWAAFSGVPKGWNWGAGLWHAAADRPGWLQVKATSYDNPFIRHDRLDEIRLSVPDRLFRQEYLAEIVDDGALFRNVQACAIATPQQQAQSGHEYVIGVDWGKWEDYSVFTVIDQTTRECVHVDRSNHVDYLIQLERLKALHARFRCRQIVVETNSNEALIELLRRSALPIVEFRTTNQSKAAIIDSLIVAFEQSDIRIIPHDVLVAELQAFKATPLLTGLRYEAPSGMHDDCVMSLALAWHAARHVATFRVSRRG